MNIIFSFDIDILKIITHWVVGKPKFMKGINFLRTKVWFVSLTPIEI